MTIRATVNGTLKPNAVPSWGSESARAGELHMPAAQHAPPAAAAPVAPPAIGAEFGRYRVVKRLGGGGMGSVYLASDPLLDRLVALKIPYLDSADNTELLTRFGREARAAAALRHENICAVFDVGEVDGTPYLTMAYLEGPTLGEYQRQRAPLIVTRAVELVRTLALGLFEAHQQGVVHRDLKPSNIIVTPKRGPVVMDFGLALRTDEDLRITRPGAAIGTPVYMSPEQVQGDLAAMGPGCDIYSLGVILYQLLAGKVPFDGSLSDVLIGIVTGIAQPPSAHRAEVDARLDAICLKAMARVPGDRYATMADFAAALTVFLPAPARGNAPRKCSAPPPYAIGKSVPKARLATQTIKRGQWVRCRFQDARTQRARNFTGLIQTIEPLQPRAGSALPFAYRLTMLDAETLATRTLLIPRTARFAVIVENAPAAWADRRFMLLATLIAASVVGVGMLLRF
jgi:serine/threonine protein kinase